MKIAVIHYHLQPGGVTTVIMRQIRAVCGHNDFLVITGESFREGDFPAETACLPEIGYDTPGGPACVQPELAAEKITAAIRRKWPQGCDLIHVHNPFLAKNRAFLQILQALQNRGETLFLQLHDLAEDGRPDHYFAETPYPADCHFGVINSRDRDILIAAGAEPAGVHLLSNAIAPLPEPAAPPPPEALLLYPVRAIRRKNVGEAILLSLFFENQEVLAITLGPNSPADIPAYQDWQAFTARHHLPVQFAASARRPFPELVAACSGFLTTSISEGFGFSFLEPWTAGKPLTGRRLPRICVDFEKKGVRLDHLYLRLAIPTAWLDLPELQEKIRRAVARSSRGYGTALPPEKIRALLELTEKETIDFGLLDETLQKQVLTRLLGSDRDKRELAERNPALRNLNRPPGKDCLRANHHAIKRHFNDSTCGGELVNAYRTAAGTAIRHHLDKSRILERFFDPEHFTLLKWGEYDGP